MRTTVTIGIRILWASWISLSVCLFSSEIAWAQTAKKAKPRIRLEYLKTSSDHRYLIVDVINKEGQVYVPVPNVEVELYLIEESPDNQLGAVTTGPDGTERFELGSKFYQALDTLDEFYFIATLSDNPDFRDADQDLTIREVYLLIDLEDLDSLKTIHAKVYTEDSVGTSVPQEDVEIKFLVQRLFSKLPLSEEYNATDDEGKLSMVFPLDLPGDSAGQVTIITRIEEHDEFGTVESSETLNWGIPIHLDPRKLPRALWSPNAPLWMVITFVILMSGVWFHFIWVAFNLYKMAKDRSVEQPGPVV